MSARWIGFSQIAVFKKFFFLDSQSRSWNMLEWTSALLISLMLDFIIMAIFHKVFVYSSPYFLCNGRFFPVTAELTETSSQFRWAKQDRRHNLKKETLRVITKQRLEVQQKSVIWLFLDYWNICLNRFWVLVDCSLQVFIALLSKIFIW